VPPGARFDPIGPFGNNPNRQPQGSFGPRGSGPGRNFRGEPDNDELPPPVCLFQIMLEIVGTRINY
jgi:proteasome inhibitor subunit 1 (PI31)